MPFHKGITRKPDGKIGINKTNPVTEFDVNGGLKIGSTITEEEGVIRWNATEKYYEFYNGVDWQRMGAGGVELTELVLAIPSIEAHPAENYGVPGLRWSQELVDLQTLVPAVASTEDTRSTALVDTDPVLEYLLED